MSRTVPLFATERDRNAADRVCERMGESNSRSAWETEALRAPLELGPGKTWNDLVIRADGALATVAVVDPCRLLREAGLRHGPT